MIKKNYIIIRDILLKILEIIIMKTEYFIPEDNNIPTNNLQTYRV